MRSVRHVGLILLIALLLPAGPLWAAKLQEPKVDYSADMVMEMEQGTMKARVHHSSGKQRMEMGEGGIATIVRRDKKVIWQLMPGGMYIESPLKEDPNDLKAMDVEQTAVGEETINGIKTTKYKMIGTTKEGKKWGGFAWITKDNIMVKADMLFKDGNEKHRMAIEMKNLKIAKQDPQLFEVPPGSQKNDMGAMMGRGGPGGGDAPPSKEQIDKMMKEMMGR